MHRTHKHFHFFLISHLPADLKRRSLVAPRPDHPRLMRKQLRRLLCPRSLRPGAVRSSGGEGKKTKTQTHPLPLYLPSARHLLLPQIRFSSLEPLLPFTVAADSLSLSLFLHPLCSLPRSLLPSRSSGLLWVWTDHSHNG